MKLLSRSVKPLSKLEKALYKPLLAPVECVDRKTYFLAHSDVYKPGDEHVLPYPERCTKGTWLSSLSQKLAQSELAVILKPKNPSVAKLLQAKLKKLHETKVYVCSDSEVDASVYGRFGSPFDYWRDEPARLLPNLPEISLVAIDPPTALFEGHSDEFSLEGALVQSEVDVEEYIRQLSASQTYSRELLYMKTLAGLGLTKVTALENGIYLSHA